VIQQNSRISTSAITAVRLEGLFSVGPGRIPISYVHSSSAIVTSAYSDAPYRSLQNILFVYNDSCKFSLQFEV